MFNGSAAWGDYNNDGRQDLVLTGETSSGYIAKVFRNERIDFGGGIPFNYGISFEEETGPTCPVLWAMPPGETTTTMAKSISC